MSSYATSTSPAIPLSAIVLQTHLHVERSSKLAEKYWILQYSICKKCGKICTKHSINSKSFDLSKSNIYHEQTPLNTFCDSRILVKKKVIPKLHSFCGEVIIYQMLIKSNQLEGVGSVNMPTNTTAGVKPHNRRVLDFWNMKLTSKTLVIISGDFMSAVTPLDLRRLGTGILFMCV